MITTTSPATTLSRSIPSTASSCDSNTFAGPRKWKMLSSTPAVFTTQPSRAILPRRTARPPSFTYACSKSRMHPFSRSVSRVSYVQFCEPSTRFFFSPGALFHIASASASKFLPPIAYFSIASPRVNPSTRFTVVSMMPWSARTFMIEMIPPARFTS